MSPPITFVVSICLACFHIYGQQPEERSGHPPTISTLKFLDEYEIPFDFSFQKTVVGGLSGIDYDKTRDIFYLISDDRGSHGHIRFYTAAISFDSMKIAGVEFKDVTYFQTDAGSRFDRERLGRNPDPESLRFHSPSNQIYWTSEGERVISERGSVLNDPFIKVADLTGRYKATVALPECLKVQASPKGPRRNSALEGITFDRTFENFYASMEEPLYEDGPKADTVYNGATVRLFKFRGLDGKNLAQYGYELDPVAYAPVPSDKLMINGLSEILFAGNESLITIERSFSMGRLPCTIKVFLTSLSGADDIRNIKSLSTHRRYTKTQKKLLLNMDSLGIYTDNIEGVTFGPSLPNGHSTLIFISDNNFNWFQKTQLLLFEVIP